MSKIKEITSKKFAVIGILDIPFNEQSRSSLIQIEQNRPLVSWKCQKYVKLIFKGLGTKSYTHYTCTYIIHILYNISSYHSDREGSTLLSTLCVACARCCLAAARLLHYVTTYLV